MQELIASKTLLRIAIWSSVLASIFGIAISVVTSRFSTAQLSDGLTSPGLALEVPNSPEQIYEVIGKPGDQSATARSDRQIATWAQYVDIPLIFCYVALFASAGLLQAQGMKGIWRWLGLAGAVLACLGGICDGFEDYHILRAVQQVAAGSAPDPFAIALWGWRKWLLLFLVLLSTAPLPANRAADRSLARHSAALRWIGLVVAGWMVSSAVGGLLARYFQHRLRLASASPGFAALPLFFFPFYPLFKEGVMRGLDGLAQWWPLAKLTEWPRKPKDVRTDG